MLPKDSSDGMWVWVGLSDGGPPALAQCRDLGVENIHGMARLLLGELMLLLLCRCWDSSEVQLYQLQPLLIVTGQSYPAP